jgi:hypothetical protein
VTSHLSLRKQDFHAPISTTEQILVSLSVSIIRQILHKCKISFSKHIMPSCIELQENLDVFEEQNNKRIKETVKI